MKPTGVQARWIELGPGRRVHALVAGVDRGLTVVLLPGNICSVGDFELLMPVLAARHRVVAVDVPGREPTAWPDEPFDFVRDLPDVLDAVLDACGIGPHIVVGHSMGGMLALQHAYRAGDVVRGIVLLEGFTTLDIHSRTVAPDSARPLGMAADVEARWRARRAANRAWAALHPRFDATFWPSQRGHDARSWVGDLGVPMQLLIADRGQPIPRDPAALAAYVGMATVADLSIELIPDAGHWLMLDQPGAVNAKVLAFVDRVHAGR